MMLAQSSGDIIKYSEFAASLGVSEPTVKKYLDIAEGTFIWSSLRAFDKNSKKRLIKMPKGYLRDTLLINHSYKLSDIDQMLSRPSFCYYRTQNKAEIDLVIETSKSLIPVEIKTNSSFKKDHILNMKKFMEEYQ